MLSTLELKPDRGEWLLFFPSTSEAPLSISLQILNQCSRRQTLAQPRSDDSSSFSARPIFLCSRL